ncbi:MAG: bacillithiol biosynthesis cysteine-adding enzyme BshC [Gemmatimonadaceae bacterium]|nr:bacillithiol biosynthesis cysteine-adding enzyme BshC [Chitinophagaceae bacterium]
MDCNSSSISYAGTGSFTKIILDYLADSQELSPFYAHRPDKKGIDGAIKNRTKFPTDRRLIHKVLRAQYAGLSAAKAVDENIEKLLDENTFTIVTAHQPAIFTGPLYFIYKILHTVRLANELNAEKKGMHFVPVFYMGSEDADLEELGKFYLGADKIVWPTTQTGAVGRMNTKGLDKLISRVEGELSVKPFGKELVSMLKASYDGNDNIQQATFKFLHALFAEYGLIILIPDSADLKRAMIPVFTDELFNQCSSAIVQETIEKLGTHYKVQASPREINLFYLKDDNRERIEKKEDRWIVVNRDISFSADELKAELDAYPERFSPNVILRGLFQETVLPNIVFIGGGGELAYWLELKSLFENYQTPFPVLVLRNSFLLVEDKYSERISKLSLDVKDFFQNANVILTSVVKRKMNGSLELQDEVTEVGNMYAQLRKKAEKIDKSLTRHISALEVKTLKPLKELEKKMLRAEKRKYEDQHRQIQAVRTALFPSDSLQERIESFMPWYAQHGRAFLDCILQNSPALTDGFVILETRKS